MSNELYIFCVSDNDCVQPGRPVCLYSGPRSGFGPRECHRLFRYLLIRTVRNVTCTLNCRTFDIPRSASVEDIREFAEGIDCVELVRDMYCERYEVFVINACNLMSFLIDRRAIEDVRMEIIYSYGDSDSDDEESE